MVKIGDRLLVSPAGVEVRVRSIHAQNQVATCGVRGQRCALNLVGPDFSKTDIARGAWVVAASAHAPSLRFDAELHLLPEELRPLPHWTPVHCHLGASFASARVAVLDGVAIAPAQSALVQLVLDRPVSACHGDRFIIRDQSAQRTLGGGRVIDPSPPTRGRRAPARLAVLEAMRQTSATAALRDLLALCDAGVNLDAFARTYNLTRAEAATLYDEVGLVPLALSGTDYGFTEQRLTTLEGNLLALLQSYHERNSDLAGPAAWQLKRDSSENLGLPMVSAIADRLVASGKVLRRGALYCMPEHQPIISPTERRLRESILPTLQSAHCKPPRVRELGNGTAASDRLVRTALKRLADEGEVYRVTDDFYFSRDAVQELARRTQAILAREPDGIASVPTLRDGLGMGRNLLIEVLEFFDRQGFTFRVPKGRRLRREPGVIFGGAASANLGGKE